MTTELLLFCCCVLEGGPELLFYYWDADEDACFIAFAEIYFIPAKFIVFEYHCLPPLAVGILLLMLF